MLWIRVEITETTLLSIAQQCEERLGSLGGSVFTKCRPVGYGGKLFAGYPQSAIARRSKGTRGLCLKRIMRTMSSPSRKHLGSI